MKKFSGLAALVMILFVFSPMVFAKSDTVGTGEGTSTSKAMVSPTTGIGVQNKNQVQTQNSGEDQELMVQTTEQEEDRVGTKSAAPRSENALENMSEVASGVEEILTTRTLSGGIGDQVRLIAQEQKQSQEQVQEQINKVDDRKAFLKLLIGPDYKALNNIEKQIEQNSLRIEALTELKNQLVNSGDIEMVQETINALIEQNVSLQELVEGENSEGSLLGWLIRLFVK